MISANNVTLRIGKKALFEDVNIKFTEGNCYGLIGANGAGKSTFLKILTWTSWSQQTVISPSLPASDFLFLQQDHFKYDAYTVLDTVIMGNKRLYEIMKEKDAIYAKEDFSEEDGIRASELEAEFADMDGWECRIRCCYHAERSWNRHGIPLQYNERSARSTERLKSCLHRHYSEIRIFCCSMSRQTTWIWMPSAWLEEFLINFENTVIVVSHDRYFLNKVCTHIADIDYAKIQLYAGNYDFWYESSQLMIKQMKEANKKKEEKIKELQEFISRFSVQMLPNPNRLLPENMPWKKSSWMRCNRPAVNIHTLISAQPRDRK